MTGRREILEAAMQAVTVDRAATHGRVERNFGDLAAIWSVRLGCAVTPEQVALMLIDLKLVRAWGNPGHRDNWVDVAGYAACGGEIALGDAPEADPVVVNEEVAPPDYFPGPRQAVAERAVLAKHVDERRRKLDQPPKPKASTHKTGAWDDWEDMKLIHMAASGKSVVEIAAELNRSSPGVGRKMYLFREEIEATRAQGGKRALAAEVATTPEEEAPEEDVRAPVPGTFRSQIEANPEFSLAEKAINAHLNALGYAGGWTPSLDHQLVTGLVSGTSIETISKVILADQAEATGRWRALNQHIGDLDHQARLVKVLRYRDLNGWV